MASYTGGPRAAATITDFEREAFMLELVRSHTSPRIARYEAARDDLDEAHDAVWQAVRHLFPSNAMVDQVDYGCLLVSWALGGRRRGTAHFAAPIMIRIEPNLLLALWTCGAEGRREIAAMQVPVVEQALESYDPHSRVPRCGVVILGE